MNMPPTGLPAGWSFNDDEVCAEIHRYWRDIPKWSSDALRAHVVAQLAEKEAQHKVTQDALVAVLGKALECADRECHELRRWEAEAREIIAQLKNDPVQITEPTAH